MGMYTEITTNLILKSDTPKEVINRLIQMIHHPDGPENLPAIDHPLFSCDRWGYLFSMGSAYFDTDPSASLTLKTGGTWALVSVANLKNYNGEIAKFADWIRPYCLPQEAAIVTSEYEETRGDLTCYYQNGQVGEVRDEPVGGDW